MMSTKIIIYCRFWGKKTHNVISRRGRKIGAAACRRPIDIIFVCTRGRLYRTWAVLEQADGRVLRRAIHDNN